MRYCLPWFAVLRMAIFAAALITLLLVSSLTPALAQPATSLDEIRAAAQRSVRLLELASEGSANERSCFTCHSQAMPVFALTEARKRGIAINESNLQRQIAHTRKHLERGKSGYENGKGQGGGVDTAGYALWTLHEGGHPADEVTEPSPSGWLHRSAPMASGNALAFGPLRKPVTSPLPTSPSERSTLTARPNKRTQLMKPELPL